jgi:hypothetical protein
MFISRYRRAAQREGIQFSRGFGGSEEAVE